MPEMEITMANNTKKKTYTIVLSTVEVEDKCYQSYGIAYKSENKTTKVISDISIDKEKVEKLVSLINDEDLDPSQLEDVIEDMIG